MFRSRSKKYGKRRSFKKRSFGKKRKYSVGRKSSKKRSYISAKRRRVSSRGSILRRINAPSFPMNVIPKTADRLHSVLNYKMRGQLSWANTAENHIGMILKPCHIGASSVTNGPYLLSWPAGGANVLFPRAVSTTPGFLTVCSRYNRYYVSSAKIMVRAVRQESADSCTAIMGMMPLTTGQFSEMVLRNTTLSPNTNNSYWLPQNGATDTTLSTGLTNDSQLLCIRQQPYVKMTSISTPVNGKLIGKLTQQYSAKKFIQMGFPFGDEFSGITPNGLATDGSPPDEQFYHYFFMQRTSAGTPGNEAFDLDFDIQLHVTFHDPSFMQNAPTYTSESKEEKKSEEKEMDDDQEDLVDPQLTPLPSLSDLKISSPPSSYTSTCLNSSHPSGPHTRVGTCI